MQPKKTNAARLLDELHIPYTLHAAAVDEDDLSATTMAATLGVPPEEVFKTLVLRGDRTGMLLVCIPGPAELDLKAVARASGNKTADMVPLKEVFPLTGYVRGGCSPLCTKKAAPVFIDENLFLLNRVFVSAGQRGLQLCLTPTDLISATRGTCAPLIRAESL